MSSLVFPLYMAFALFGLGVINVAAWRKLRELEVIIGGADSNSAPLARVASRLSLMLKGEVHSLDAGLSIVHGTVEKGVTGSYARKIQR